MSAARIKSPSSTQPGDKVSRLVDNLKWLVLLGGSMGTVLPGVSFFTDYAPPMLISSGLLTSGVALVVLIWGFTRSPRRSRKAWRPLVCVLVALVLVIVYGILLDYTTVDPPGGRIGPRIQIGFYMAPWSLTGDAREFIERSRVVPTIQIITPTDLMLAFGAFPDGIVRPDHIWRTRWIVTAGSLLMAVFVVGFVLWTYGFGTLARVIADKGNKRRLWAV